MSCPSGLKHFKHASCTLAGAHAHRDDAVFGVLGFQFIQKLHGEFGPSATQGVSKGDGATVHQPLLSPARIQCRQTQGLRGEEGCPILDRTRQGFTANWAGTSLKRTLRGGPGALLGHCP